MVSISLVMFLTLIAALVASAAQFLFKKGVPTELYRVRSVIPLLKNKHILYGIAVNIAAFAIYIYALSAAPLSFVYPIFASTFIFTGLIAHFVFHEELKPMRTAGMALVFIGILVISLTL